MDSFLFYFGLSPVLGILLISLICFPRIFSNKTKPNRTDTLEPLEIIQFPCDSKGNHYKAKIYVHYENKTILENAKKLVDKNYPFHSLPHGGTVYSVVPKREYYLNQYLWFFQKNKRFPRTDEFIVENYPPFGKFNYEIKPHSWFKLTNKKELKYIKLLNQLKHVSLELKTLKGNEYLRCVEKYDRLDKELSKISEKDEELILRLHS